jgi:cytochrome P450
MMTELIDQREAEVHTAKDHGTQDGLSDDMLTRMIEASAAEEQKLSKQELIDIVSCQLNPLLC